MNNQPRYLAFDIEIAKILPDDVQDWSPHRPLGISCAATLSDDGELTLWYGKTSTADFTPQMSIEETQSMVEYLKSASDSGYQILTWNGLGFDFDILAEESDMLSACRELALNHTDMMFHIFCLKGYPLGLDKAAKGMGLKGKPFGMSGEMAPRMWKDGQFQEVLEYAQQDVHTTLDLAKVTEIHNQLKWISNRGKSQYLPLSSGWLTVQEAQTLPLPDTSWMSDPWPRTKFSKWLET
ncbi:ribonuclease H-like domain-containing protein [Chloroflexota bacterium]